MSATHKFMQIDGKLHEIHNVVVHKFVCFDEDYQISIGDELYRWENSESGSWVMANAIEPPSWSRMPDLNTMGNRIVIVAKLKDEDAVFYNLKWNSK
jgi:hypothetical protein